MMIKVYYPDGRLDSEFNDIHFRVAVLRAAGLPGGEGIVRMYDANRPIAQLWVYDTDFIGTDESCTDESCTDESCTDESCTDESWMDESWKIDDCDTGERLYYQNYHDVLLELEDAVIIWVEFGLPFHWKIVSPRGEFVGWFDLPGVL